MRVQFLWHSFFKISFQGLNILIDPFMEMPKGETAYNLAMKCPVNLGKIKSIDAIFVSNEHFDHCDKKVIEMIANRDNSVVVAHESVLNDLGIAANLKHAVKVGDRFNLRGMDVTVRGAHYPNSFYPMSFHLSKDNEAIFFAGNSALMDSFSEINCDVALLPIGGASTMDVVDAVRATKTIKPKFAVPMHYNSFDNIPADPQEFKMRIDKSILKTQPVILKPGQSFKTK